MWYLCGQSKKVIYSGLPLREALFNSGTNSFKFENKLPVLYITAGKTGSRKINQAIQKCLPLLLKSYNVIHQCGDHSEYRDFESLNRIYEAISEVGPGQYYLRKFVYDDEIGGNLFVIVTQCFVCRPGVTNSTRIHC